MLSLSKSDDADGHAHARMYCLGSCEWCCDIERVLALVILMLFGRNGCHYCDNSNDILIVDWWFCR